MTRALPIEVRRSRGAAAACLRLDAINGLLSRPKWLPPKWFYDARGSELFEQITRLPEYYPTRTEHTILTSVADEFAHTARAAGVDTLVELGSGSSTKTRLLIEAQLRTGALRRFVPLDMSAAALEDSIEILIDRYPRLATHGIVADFTLDLASLAAVPGRRAVAFLGGTIGNLTPPERATFLARLRAALRPEELFLLGAALVIDEPTLVAAYDDAAGVTAEFNRNVLHVLNRELDADFDVASFEHVAVWDAAREWIEMRLRATRRMSIRLRALDLCIRFAAGEEMRTEISAKFRRGPLAAELRAAGFRTLSWHTDPDHRFAVVVAAAA